MVEWLQDSANCESTWSDTVTVERVEGDEYFWDTKHVRYHRSTIKEVNPCVNATARAVGEIVLARISAADTAPNMFFKDKDMDLLLLPYLIGVHAGVALAEDRISTQEYATLGVYVCGAHPSDLIATWDKAQEAKDEQRRAHIEHAEDIDEDRYLGCE